ncbi:hypothetical protein [Dyella silvatica]|uniref:hypothetical protein n=1 Tax=Dyella silvatica TaxID=2992128 RepID=UPI00224CDA34|nr:hypothetical protein [Dyella silvatica]
MKFNTLNASRLTKVWLPTLMLALATLLPMVAQAQQAAPGPALPEADIQAIKNYNLNDDVFNRLLAATKEARAAGIKPQAGPGPGQVKNLDELAERAVSGDPRIKPLIQKNGFTPREFMLANLALMNAAIAWQAKSDPQAAARIDQSKVNQANVAFFESHQAQLNALTQQGAPASPAPQGK